MAAQPTGSVCRFWPTGTLRDNPEQVEEVHQLVVELLEIMVLALGVPIVLFGLMMLLAGFEAALVQPGERAAKVVELLHSADAPEEVEQQTAKMLEVVVPPGPREDLDDDVA